MFQLDTTFLQDVGLGNLPEDQKRELLHHLYQEVQTRVGERLTENMPEAELDEFATITEGDESKVRSWLEKHIQGYVERDDFKQLLESAKVPADSAAYVNVLRGYAATKWLELHRPNYKEVVEEVVDEIKQSLRNFKAEILDPLNTGEK